MAGVSARRPCCTGGEAEALREATGKRPEEARRGTGQATSPEIEESTAGRASSQPTRRVRAKGLWAHGRSAPPWVHHSRARWPGGSHRAPVRPQVRLRPSPQLGRKMSRSNPTSCHRPLQVLFDPQHCGGAATGVRTVKLLLTFCSCVCQCYHHRKVKPLKLSQTPGG